MMVSQDSYSGTEPACSNASRKSATISGERRIGNWPPVFAKLSAILAR
jgi:hypothetical protein